MNWVANILKYRMYSIRFSSQEGKTTRKNYKNSGNYISEGCIFKSKVKKNIKEKKTIDIQVGRIVSIRKAVTQQDSTI